ncbi:MAG: hypothetical protein ACI92I_000677 [Acidimicrobiales bacterium]|jgi:hypothetical protein
MNFSTKILTGSVILLMIVVCIVIYFSPVEEAGKQNQLVNRVVQEQSQVTYKDNGLPSPYYSDGIDIYYNEVKIPIHDPASFSVLSTEFGIDNDYVYALCNDVLGDCLFSVMPDIDPQTFSLNAGIPNDDGSLYAKDSTHVILKSFMRDVTPTGGFRNIDSLEFVPSTGWHRYMKDKYSVYVTHNLKRSYTELAGADPFTFMILGHGVSQYVGSEEMYAKDMFNVYFGKEMVNGADLESFQLVQNITRDSEYDAQDKNYRYINGKRVE